MSPKLIISTYIINWFLKDFALLFTYLALFSLFSCSPVYNLTLCIHLLTFLLPDTFFQKINLFLAVLGLHCLWVGGILQLQGAGGSSSLGCTGFSLQRLLVAEHRLSGAWASVAEIHAQRGGLCALGHAGFSGCGSQLFLPHARGIFLDQGRNPCLLH